MGNLRPGTYSLRLAAEPSPLVGVQGFTPGVYSIVLNGENKIWVVSQTDDGNYTLSIQGPEELPCSFKTKMAIWLQTPGHLQLSSSLTDQMIFLEDLVKDPQVPEIQKCCRSDVGGSEPYSKELGDWKFVLWTQTLELRAKNEAVTSVRSHHARAIGQNDDTRLAHLSAALHRKNYRTNTNDEMNVLYQIINLLGMTRFPEGATDVFLEAFTSVAFYTLIPRLVISIRELYDRDIRGSFHTVHSVRILNIDIQPNVHRDGFIFTGPTRSSVFIASLPHSTPEFNGTTRVKPTPEKYKHASQLFSKNTPGRLA
ncbi:hypothetical protein L210DRAFT_3499699 [Boletus edulis BED1]|uniref:Uncharacterized protein n=1 Tax=Boletus edulis BED1 TaxID=1328754 RepID=A0AAD4C9R4_BOLED|nr:hypothetical protein L210DRAFT_3499699 [Boletus edulis BED1]